MRYVGWAVSAIGLLLAAGSFGVGCVGSSEGQPCSTLGNDMGDSECKDGLVCTATEDLNGGGMGYLKAVCCPSNRADAKTLICMNSPNPVADASPPAEAGPTDAGEDGGGEDSAATDAPVDTSSTTDTGSETGPADAKTDSKGESSPDAHTEGG